MKKLFIVPLLVLYLNALEYKSNLSIKNISYNNFSNESVFSGDTSLKYERDSFSLNTKLDYLYSTEYKKRRYLELDELFFLKEFDESSLNIGKSIQYWGELEGYNVADIYNKKHYISDPFNKDEKLGSWGVLNSFYLEDSTLQVGAKFYEEELTYPNIDDPYYPFALNYTSELKTSSSKYKPTLFLNYSFETDDLIQSENKLIFWYGYDSKRFISMFNQNTLQQNTYITNKFLYLSNIVYEDYIFKIESVISDVKTDILSDYAQITFGVERSLYDIKSSDLTFYLEYYKYKYFNDSQKNIDISEIYNDDLFLALRLNLNDVKDSELKCGVLFDKHNSERVLKIQFKTRVIDALVLSAELLNIVAKDNTALSKFGNDTRTSLALTYSF